MPGFILHLSAGVLAIDAFQNLNFHMSSREKNDFLMGCLLPDASKKKDASHFRNPKHHGNIVEYPDLELLEQKYHGLLGDMSCLGYEFHLYIDRVFFKDYLPRIVEFQDDAGKVVKKWTDVTWAVLRKNHKRLKVKQFFSEDYYYGDYTKMNSWLIDKLHIPLTLQTDVKNPGIEEVDYAKGKDILEELKGYLDVPKEAIAELKVFDVEDLLGFLKKKTQIWCESKIQDMAHRNEVLK